MSAVGRSSLPDPELVVESEGYDVSDGQLLMGRLQWDGSSDISPSDSASSKASEFAAIHYIMLTFILRTCLFFKVI